MHYQLWDSASSNVIDVFQTEAEGLAMVRRLLSSGWDPERLTMGLDFDEDEEGDDASLPPVLYGKALAQRALASASDTLHLRV
jgi:hypothetical protein